jgi:hypothetical protein
LKVKACKTQARRKAERLYGAILDYRKQSAQDARARLANRHNRSWLVHVGLRDRIKPEEVTHDSLEWNCPLAGREFQLAESVADRVALACAITVTHYVTLTGDELYFLSEEFYEEHFARWEPTD